MPLRGQRLRRKRLWTVRRYLRQRFHRTEELEYGGAFYIYQDCSGTTTVEDSTFTENFAKNGGGAIYYAPFSVCLFSCTGSTFTANVADEGGALYVEGEYGSTSRLFDNRFRENISGSNGGGAYLEVEYGNWLEMVSNDFYRNEAEECGGGAYLHAYDDGPSFSVDRCSFRENRSGSEGGGLCFTNDDDDYCVGLFSLTNSVLTGNRSEGVGGGLYLYQEYGDLVVGNNLLAGNESGSAGGGIYLYSEYVRYADLVNNTVTGNAVSGDATGGGLYVECGDDNTVYSLANNIVWNNAAAGNSSDLFLCDEGHTNYFYLDGNDYSYLSTDFTASSDLFESGNLDTDPLFVSSADFHLQTVSPLIDRGDSEVRSLGETDLEGRMRVYGDNVDMGAYEYIPPSAGDGDAHSGVSGIGSSGGCSVGFSAPAMLLLGLPLFFLRRKR